MKVTEMQIIMVDMNMRTPLIAKSAVFQIPRLCATTEIANHTRTTATKSRAGEAKTGRSTNVTSSV